MLPTIFGSGLSAFLIQYSEVLSYVGLGIVFGFTGLSAMELRREMQLKNSDGYDTVDRLNDNHMSESKNERGQEEKN
jgi:hypothetical protein